MSITPSGSSNSSTAIVGKPRSSVEESLSGLHNTSSLKSKNRLLTKEKQKAVCIRNGNKAYGSRKNRTVIFENLNMTVPKGCIYGLLGASGCGKTTLLSCILGRHKLDSGQIWVLGRNPTIRMPGSRVGYMPQELSLYFEFTIRETMVYFGWLSKMKTKQIDERMKFLMPFLDLPDAKRRVAELSGGQRRRVSFAVALLHNPEMLILDEPTAGVDPILRQNIWDHLVAITNDDMTTVLVTTHYIDEAKQADLIALMRGGRFLAEESPSSLLSHYNCENLEDVFLNLSLWQNRVMGNREHLLLEGPKDSLIIKKLVQGSKDIKQTLSTIPNDFGQDKVPPYEKDPYEWKHYFTIFKCHHMKALIWKNFLTMIRNISMMLLLCFLPLIQTIIFCYTIGRDPHGLKLSVLNYELKGTESCDKSKISILFSCQYLDKLKSRDYILVNYETHDAALHSVKKGWSWAMLEFSETFTSSLKYRFEHFKVVNESTIENSTIYVHLDKSDRQIALQLNRDLHLAFDEFSTKVAERSGYNPRLVTIPVLFEKPVHGTLEPNFTEFVAPGAILTIIFFLALSSTSASLVIERSEGMIERALVAGVTSVEILMAHAITQFTIVFSNSLSVVIFMIFIFKLPNKGDLKLIFLMTTLNGICGMAYGFVVACLTNSENGAVYLSMGSFMPVIILCGMLWPVEGMHKILRTISCVLPLTYPAEALRSILGRGWDLHHPHVYLGFIAISVWTVIFTIVSITIAKIRKL